MVRQGQFSIGFHFFDLSSSRDSRGNTGGAKAAEALNPSPPFEGVKCVPIDRFRLPSPATFSNDALFRTFAETDVSLKGIQDFMHSFAPLWAPVERGAVDEEGRLVLFVPKALPKKKLSRDWPDQILELRQCVRLWDLFRAGDEHGLARHIRWQADSVGRLSVHYDSHPDLKPGAAAPAPERRVTEVIISGLADSELLDSLRPGDVRSSALLFIERRINLHLGGQLHARLYYDPRSETAMFLSIPLNLFSGIWTQFARAVAENKRYARCKECDRWFETSIPGMRSTRMYCSDLCKIKAHLERKQKAIQLKAEGMTLKEIAKVLGIGEDKVSRWEREK